MKTPMFIIFVCFLICTLFVGTEQNCSELNAGPIQQDLQESLKKAEEEVSRIRSYRDDCVCKGASCVLIPLIFFGCFYPVAMCISPSAMCSLETVAGVAIASGGATGSLYCAICCAGAYPECISDCKRQSSACCSGDLSRAVAKKRELQNAVARLNRERGLPPVQLQMDPARMSPHDRSEDVRLS